MIHCFFCLPGYLFGWMCGPIGVDIDSSVIYINNKRHPQNKYDNKKTIKNMLETVAIL